MGEGYPGPGTVPRSPKFVGLFFGESGGVSEKDRTSGLLDTPDQAEVLVEAWSWVKCFYAKDRC